MILVAFVYLYSSIKSVSHFHLSTFQLKFEDDLKITCMYSAEGEAVPFKETLYPTGNVEDWLLEVERVMRESLRQTIGDAIINYKEVRALGYVHLSCVQRER